MDVLAEVVRSGLVESRHRGVAVCVDATGEVSWSIGDPETVVFPRSANKPFQALGLLRAGLDLASLGLGEADLAMAAASHSAEPFHLDRVRAILSAVGLDESALQTPASYPVDGHEHAEVIRRGQTRQPIFMDCSGKHAAMLACCVVNGWSIDDYLDPDHPVQVAILEAFTDLVGAPQVVGVDGCGAPLFSARLVDLARGVATLTTAPGDSAEGRIAHAMSAHPEYVSGTRRGDLALARAVPGALVKSGADANLVIGTAAGAMALKVEDGGERALFAIGRRVVDLVGWPTSGPASWPMVLGGGSPVGQIRPAF